MPVVPTDQVKTDEVKAWKGVHLLYFDGSLCVRKVQLVLALKGIEYTRAPVSPMNLRSEWYLGINPRGLVPALVHDGEVIIESNDILAHLEARFPTEPKLTSTEPAEAESVAEYLRIQDGYHMHIRTLTFKHKFPKWALVQMAAGKVSQMDKKDAELGFWMWRALAARGAPTSGRSTKQWSPTKAFRSRRSPPAWHTSARPSRPSTQTTGSASTWLARH